MRKYTKFLVIAIVAVLVLAAGFTTVAFASGSSSKEGNGPAQTFISKVASILGLEEEQVADAFKQARHEMRDEAWEQRLQEAINSGELTEEQANEIREWWQDRPEVLEDFVPHKCLQPRNICRCRPQVCDRPCLRRHLICPAWIFDEHLNGTVTSVSSETDTVTLATETDDEVNFQYTSNTIFVLRGTTTLEVGEMATFVS